MNEAQVKEHRRLMLACHDFEEAKKFGRELAALRASNQAQPIHVEAMVMAAIVRYARPFKCSWSGGLADKTVSAEVLFDMLDGLHDTSKQRELHAEIITWRDQAVAHSDWSSHCVGTEADDAHLMLTLVASSLIPDTSAFLDLASDMSRASITRAMMLQERGA